VPEAGVYVAYSSSSKHLAPKVRAFPIAAVVPCDTFDRGGNKAGAYSGHDLSNGCDNEGVGVIIFGTLGRF
jgi:hypothetical protein